jgi:hypothetical protein
MFGRKQKCVERFGGGEPLGPGVDERVILKWILRKEVGFRGHGLDESG